MKPPFCLHDRTEPLFLPTTELGSPSEAAKSASPPSGLSLPEAQLWHATERLAMCIAELEAGAGL